MTSTLNDNDELVNIQLPIMAADHEVAEAQIKRDYAKRINGRPVEFIWVHDSNVYLIIKNE